MDNKFTDSVLEHATAPKTKHGYVREMFMLQLNVTKAA